MRLLKTLALLLALPFLTGSPAHGQPGTTLITHGFQATADLPEWPQLLALAMAERVPGPSQVLQYDPPTGGWILIAGTPTVDAELFLVVDWSQDSVWVPGFVDDRVGSAHGAADAVAAAVLDPLLPTAVPAGTLLTDSVGAARPLHLIGHSRGTAVNSEIARRLLAAGVGIDHVTTLDPHPVADLLDPSPETWEGIEWADNFWRADGCDFDFGCFGFDFDGAPVAGAFDVELSVLEDLSWIDNRLAPCSLEHILVHTWYHGTADLGTSSDGSCPIDRSDWYPNGGVDEGFYYSRFGGGVADRPCGPDGGCPDAGRTPLDLPAPLVNGDFEFGGGQPSGWLWHGGGGSGEILESGSERFLRLSPTGDERTHNRFWLPSGASTLEFQLRVTAPDPTDLDVVSAELLRDGVTAAVGDVEVGTAATGWVPVMLAIPATVARDRSYALRLSVGAPGGGGALSTVDLDDVTFTVSALPRFIRGDCNGDLGFNLADAVALLATLFTGAASPDCDAACDANSDLGLDVADAVYMLSALFTGGPPPAAPHPSCGVDAAAASCALSACP